MPSDVAVQMQRDGKHGKLLIKRCQYWHHSHDSCLWLCVRTHVCMQLSSLCTVEALAEGDSHVLTVGALACYASWQALQRAAQSGHNLPGVTWSVSPLSEHYLSTPTRRCTTS